jgi:hypothetical protein
MPSCVLKAGELTCYRGPFGVAGQMPGPVEGAEDAVAVGIGVEAGCMLHATGKLSCWGHNHHHQIGPDINQTDTPVELPGLSLTRLAKGHHATCGIDTTGQVLCWGGSYSGPLGVPKPSESPTPIAVPGLEHAIDVKMAADLACALLADHSVRCWQDHAEPVDIGLSEIQVLGVGEGLACGANSAGAVVCDAVFVTKSQDVAGLKGVVQLSGAIFSAILCGRTAAGRVVCARGDDAGNAILTTDYPITDAVDISAGDQDFCVAHADASVSCFRYDGSPSALGGQ